MTSTLSMTDFSNPCDTEPSNPSRWQARMHVAVDLEVVQTNQGTLGTSNLLVWDQTSQKSAALISYIYILTYTSLYPFEGCALHHAELPSIAGTSGTAALMAGNFGEELLSEPTYLREELWRTFVSYGFLAFHGQLQFCMFSFCLRLFKAFGMNDFLRSSRQGLP